MPACSPLIVGDGTALIPLTRGKVATIDECDVPLVLPHTWCAVPNKRGSLFYAVTPRGIRMHSLIAGAGRLVTTNHRDRDGLNNRRANLRIRPSAFRNLIRTETPGKLPRGVKATPGGRFEARINTKAGYRHLGTFNTSQEANAAYHAAMSDLYGDWAPLPMPHHTT